MKQQSKAYELCKFVWNNETTNSNLVLNEIMKTALQLAIRAKLKFDKDDFENIYETFRGGYWFGANTNGNGCGEIFYHYTAVYNNISASKSYESFAKIKPFLLKNKRLTAHSEFFHQNRKYSVTGFKNGKMYIVIYHASGKRKLIQFTNSEWNDFRKELK